MKAILSRQTPLVYLISDRQMLARRNLRPDATTLVDYLRAAFTAGVDLIQLRERDLAPRDLLAIADDLMPAARRNGAALLINDRADVAASAGAGVHLTTRSLPANAVRRAFGDALLIGASTHHLEEASRAEDAGADFVVFGPVFETESKKAYGPPTGLVALREVVERLTIPVIALGGIKPCNFQGALETGAAGVAAIGMFVEASDLSGLVQQIKSSRRTHAETE